MTVVVALLLLIGIYCVKRERHLKLQEFSEEEQIHVIEAALSAFLQDEPSLLELPNEEVVALDAGVLFEYLCENSNYLNRIYIPDPPQLWASSKRVVDEWGQDYHVELLRKGRTHRAKLWSCGRNRRNDGGSGDDIAVALTVDVHAPLPSPSQPNQEQDNPNPPKQSQQSNE